MDVDKIAARLSEDDRLILLEADKDKLSPFGPAVRKYLENQDG